MAADNETTSLHNDDVHAEIDAEAPIAAKRKQSLYGTLPAVQAQPSAIPSVCWYILIVELCERLAFYTITGSQAFFLEHIGFGLSNSGALNATMWTLCTVLAVGASWTADVGLGRYSTIFASGCIYVLGTAMAAASAMPGQESPRFYFLAVMGLLPVATAGIKANISNFGADQYDENDPAQAAGQERFFSIFYCSINMGAALAYGFFTTFASSGGLGVPKAWGYAAAYGAMACCMMTAVFVYRSGRSGYKVHPLQERSALAAVLGSLLDVSKEGSRQAAAVSIGLFLLTVSIFLSALQSLVPSLGQGPMLCAFFAALIGTMAVVLPCREPQWILSQSPDDDNARERQDVHDFLKLLPVLITGSIAFNALYNCMQFWYAQQACQMDVRVPLGAGTFQLSGSFFNIADCLAIVAITPLAVLFVDPALTRAFRGHFGHGEKFALGMIIATMSVMAAARLEVLRKGAPVLSETSNCAPPGVGMSDMKGAWMMLPFFLMGTAEIYTQPTLLHYAYSKSPASMRTLAMAASFFIAAVSSALFALLVSALGPYMPNDLNHGHLEYGYYVNVAIGATFLLPAMSLLNSGPK